MICFSVASLVVAMRLVALHFADRRPEEARRITNMIVAVVVLAVDFVDDPDLPHR